MAEKFSELSAKHIEFINAQHVFFTGTAGATGFVNVSPKGMDCLRVINEHEVLWLNLTGSGNETAAHVLENGRMTIMFCSFDKQPLILRLYGDAQAISPRDTEWAELIAQFPSYAGSRQIYRLRISLVQTSCGYAVPYMGFEAERPTLENWAEKRGRDGLQDYWMEKNTVSLDGKPTGIDVSVQRD